MGARRGFTLIELLVVIAVIAILAALLFPVFSQAKEASKRTSCSSNVKEQILAMIMYTGDFDGEYPQTKPFTANPEIDDAAGAREEPDYGSVVDRLKPYAQSEAINGIFRCPSDPDPLGQACLNINPDAPTLSSYLFNAFLIFGLNESQISAPASMIGLTERRSGIQAGADPFCDYAYRPWYNAGNPVAPEDQMDPLTGAVATLRHMGSQNYAFMDGHLKVMHWSNTFQVNGSLNLHHP
ncbi:hypothetical protein BH11ARM1_BH11ARM1_14490 [soil metagenome]